MFNYTQHGTWDPYTRCFAKQNDLEKIDPPYFANIREFRIVFVIENNVRKNQELADKLFDKILIIMYDKNFWEPYLWCFYVFKVSVQFVGQRWDHIRDVYALEVVDSDYESTFESDGTYSEGNDTAYLSSSYELDSANETDDGTYNHTDIMNLTPEIEAEEGVQEDKRDCSACFGDSVEDKILNSTMISETSGSFEDISGLEGLNLSI